MKDFKLTISFEKFEKKTIQLITELDDLHAKELNKEFPLMQITCDNRDLSTKVDQFLSSVFTKKENKLYYKFYNRNKNRYKIPGVELGEQVKINQQKEEIRNTKQVLWEILQTVRACDLLTDSSQVNLEYRTKMTIKEKQDFLLEKLYQIMDNHTYSLLDIFEGNGLKMKRLDEVEMIAGALASKGLITVDKAVKAELTIEGQEYVEEIIQKRQAFQINLHNVMNELNGKVKPELTGIKSKLKQWVSEDLNNDFFDKLDLLLIETGTSRGIFYAIRGRFSSLNSSKIRGIISMQDEMLETNRIRDSLISWIDNLSSNDLKNQIIQLQ